MKAAEDNAATLQEHMRLTYLNVRYGIGIIGAALPLLLWIGARRLLHSMSAYYYTPMGDVFVGALVSIGVFLYLYKGFSSKENWALNAAGMLAVGIALVPTNATGEPHSTRSTTHIVFAVLFFLCIAYVAIFRASDTLSLIDDAKRRQNFQRFYRLLGLGMAASPFVAIALAYLFDPDSAARSLKLFVEVLGVWMFAVYWLAKSREISETGAERLALEGRIEASPALKNTKAIGHFVRVA
jgi:hypothetical protein